MYLLRALLFLYLFLDFFLAGRSAVRVPGTGLLELVGWFHLASQALEIGARNLPADMADASGDYGGVWSKCPTWDGSPLSWRAFNREMAWWVSSLDLESTRKFNLAARFLMRQSGTVRQRGEEFSPEELAFQPAVTAPDPQTGEQITIVEEDLLAGLNKLLAALENLNGQSVLDRRGELRTQSYLHLARRPGERVADYATRFRTAISDMKTEGVKLPDPEVGWFFKEKLGLDALRRQLLDTALQGAEAYGTIEGECLRLFRDLHLQDPLYRRLDKGSGRMTIKRIFGGGPPSGASSAPSSLPSRRPSTLTTSSSTASSRKFVPRQVQAAEAEEQEAMEAALVDGDEAEQEPEETVGDNPSLEEVLQTEVQCLAEEIAQAEEEGIDPAFCEALETEIEASAEALVSMREARVKLAEVRKDRGYKGPGVSSAGGPGKGRGKAAIAAKKASGKHLCFDCGLPGHWSGDPECSKPGAGLGRAKAKAAAKQVRVAEAEVNSHSVAEVEALANQEAHEVHMVMSLSAALRSGSSAAASEVMAASALSHDKALVGALDSACNRTCAGEEWILGYLAELQKAPASVKALSLGTGPPCQVECATGCRRSLPGTSLAYGFPVCRFPLWVFFLAVIFSMGWAACSTLVARLFDVIFLQAGHPCLWSASRRGIWP